MDVKFFGQFLIEKNIVTPDQLIRAMEIQSLCNKSIGELAVQNGWLDDREIEKIRQFQIHHNASFIAACKKLSLMDQEKIDKLFASQLSHNVLIGEALVAEKILSQEALDNAFKDFRREQSAAEFVILNAMTTHPQSELVGIIIQSTINLIRYLMNVQARIGGFVVDQKDNEGYDWTPYQVLHGDYELVYYLNLKNSFILKIASAFLKRECHEVNELTLDACKEFVNVVVGYICTSMSLKNAHAEPEVVEIMESKNYILHEKEQIRIPMLLPDDEIEIRIQINSAS